MCLTSEPDTSYIKPKMDRSYIERTIYIAAGDSDDVSCDPVFPDVGSSWNALADSRSDV